MHLNSRQQQTIGPTTNVNARFMCFHIDENIYIEITPFNTVTLVPHLLKMLLLHILETRGGKRASPIFICTVIS